MESRFEEWRDSWLDKNLSKIPTWQDLSERNNGYGLNEQDFWRTDPSKGRLSDDQLLSERLLIEVNDGRTYHAAYLPWKINGENGKMLWSEDDWIPLNHFIKNKLQNDSEDFEGFVWEGLTLRGSEISLFFKHRIKSAYVVGDIGLERYVSGNVNGWFIDGSLTGYHSQPNDCYITGDMWARDESRFEGCRLGHLKFGNKSDALHSLELIGCDIIRMSISRDMANLDIHGSRIFSCELRGLRLGRVKIDVSEVGIDFSSCRFTEVAAFKSSNLYFSSDRENLRENGGFLHSIFEKRVSFDRCDFNVFHLGECQFDSRLDIKLKSGDFEMQFDNEILRISRMSESNKEQWEYWRGQLERCSQLLCDRYRQEGRKDLEVIFRRLELKARSLREDLKLGPKTVLRGYGLVSDFGASASRPIIALVCLFLISFLIYWMIGSYVSELLICVGCEIDKSTLLHASLLSLDRLFPFGASVDEATLFSGRLFRESAGWSSFGVRLIGALQTVMSGVMLFLVGLAVRTKLLIG